MQYRSSQPGHKLARQEATDSNGLYSIPSLPPGRYTIKVLQPGFKSSTATVTLAVSQTLTADFRLEVGNVAEAITVTEESSQLALKKDSFEISQLVTQRELASLPVNGRNFLKLATLGPGAQPGSDLVNGSSNGGTTEYFESTPNNVILSANP